ncbi:hypothetical protein [Burkholderia pyrrocinia]|uniref:hypothetical protein n=1 Tax=Burkholderia pyrrocinia TaxID=60550 RepID=UPI001FC85ECC|nr:hypothetical protein [Burkholderia pyrrocinia]
MIAAEKRSGAARRAGLPAEIRIGDSVVMVGGGDGLRDPMPAFLYVYVEDAASTCRRAIAANAIPLEVPADMPCGDRRAMVKESW